MYGYIYKTTNLVNGKIYIGKHKSNCFDFDNYKGSGKLLHQAFKKYDFQNFKCELLEPIDNIPTICNSKEELNESEIYYIKYFNAQQNLNFYNIAKGGEGDTYNCLTENQKVERNKKISTKLKTIKRTPEWNAKISKARKGKFKGKENPNFGNHKLKERYASGEYISPCLGIPHTLDYKLKLSKRCKELGINKGSKNSSFGKHWYTDGKVNILTFENDIPEGFKLGRIITEEQKIKNSLSHKGKEAWNKIKILYVETNKIYLSKYDACKDLNIAGYVITKSIVENRSIKYKGKIYTFKSI